MARIRKPEHRGSALATGADPAGRFGVRRARHLQDPDASSMTQTPTIALPDPFRLYRGGTLHQARIAYESWGRLNGARDNAILLFTGMSPSAHAAASEHDPAPGWWQRMLGPGLALDSDRYFIVCVNSLGSCYGSTGPASINPATGQRYRLEFPEIAIEDIARAGYETMRALGIERLDSVIGASLGGMSVIAFGALFPRAARRLISISASPAASAFSIALRSVQREAIMRDPDWQGGQYAPEHPPRSGMRVARKLGTITYRSAAEWRQRFGREPLAGNARSLSPFAPRFAVEGYLESQAERFTRVFDANCYLYLSSAMDRFDLAEHGGSYAAALPAATCERALVIGVESDLLFPIHEQATIAEAFRQSGIPVHFAPLPSLEGHDAFLVDIPRFDAQIRAFLTGSAAP
ncbi:MAG TPA: homoserine O-acetyltransferase [Steroidobacteraceae bacterium]|jgi:homoserine O-acetyltransferase|nr:homoserine O-acetyltransferase [Steroidobacteraceae bacterium]